MNGRPLNSPRKHVMPKPIKGSRNCFLFLPETPVIETYASLVLDEGGQIIAPFEERDKASFCILQQDAKTFLVLPSTLATLHTLSLPRLPEKKAATAIQFSLEDKLSQPLTEVHLAWYYDLTNQNYTVAVIDKALLQTYVNELEEAGISYQTIGLDVSALQLNEALSTPHALLLHTATFQGAIPYSLLPLYEPLLKDITCFVESNSSVTPPMKIEEIENTKLWIAKRLLQHLPLDLCQGAFYKRPTTSSDKKLYYLTGSLGLLWLCSLFVTQGILLYQLNNKIKQVDANIAVRYKQFFPTAQHIISPRFRIEQLLKHQSPSSALWILLDKFAQASQKLTYTLQSCDYKNQKLSLILQVKQFEQLEQLTKSLQNMNIRVKQTQVSQETDHINASLEITL